MQYLRKRKVYFALLMILVLIVSMLPSAYAAAESESNNTYGTADVTYDDENNSGTMSSISDIDWWKVTFSQAGWANYYMGSIPAGCDFKLSLYSSNGTTLLEESDNADNKSELIRYNVVANTTYYIKIEAMGIPASGSTTYAFRTKWYAPDTVYAFTNDCEVDDPSTEENEKHITNFSGTTIMNNLWAMGYDGSEYKNNTATSGYNSLSKSDVYIFHNHGNKGFILFQKTNGTTIESSYIYANRSGYLSIADLSSTALADMELGVIMACYSGATSSTYGNLVDQMLSKGAKCVIGWLFETYPDSGNEWLNEFIYQLSQGEKISSALTAADKYMYDKYEGSGDVTYPMLMESRYIGTSNTAQVIG